MQIFPPLPSPLKPREPVPRPLYLSVCRFILFPSPHNNLAPVCQRRRSVFSCGHVVERCIDRGTKLTVFTHRLQTEVAEREREIPSAAVIATAFVIATAAAVLNRYVVFPRHTHL